MGEFLETKFEKMGARVKVMSLPDRLSPGPVRIDVRRDRRGEYFDVRHRSDVHVDVLDVKAHDVFKRDGHDVRIDLPITLHEAVLGGSVRTPTIGGPVMLKITPGSNTGKVMRLRGRGLLDRRTGKRGDQLVTLRVVLPEEPDDKLKAFLEEWEAGKAQDPRRHLEALA